MTTCKHGKTGMCCECSYGNSIYEHKKDRAVDVMDFMGLTLGQKEEYEDSLIEYDY